MPFVQVLVPVGVRGQDLVEEAVQVRDAEPGHYLVLRCPPGYGRQTVIEALEAAGLRSIAEPSPDAARAALDREDHLLTRRLFKGA